MASTTSSPAAGRLPRVLRDGDRVLIDRVGGFSAGEYPSSVHGAQAAVMRAVGESITYDELVGAGALAFRLQVHPTFCPSSPHAQCGWACVKGSLETLPWHVQHYHTGDLKGDKPEHAEKIRAAREAVRASIDRGIPVHYGDIEDGIIVGYQAGGNEWLCYHPLHDGGTELFVERGLSWGVLIYTERKQRPPARRPIAEEALRQAVAMWHAELSPDASRKDRMGRAAWAYWIQTLPIIEEPREGATYNRHGSAMIYQVLVGHRRSAVAYLRLIAPEFPGAAAMHLRRAADIYDEMANKVLSDSEHPASAIAPYWVPWPDAVRAEQLRRMRQAAELDAQAIGQIEAALAALQASD